MSDTADGPPDLLPPSLERPEGMIITGEKLEQMRNADSNAPLPESFFEEEEGNDNNVNKGGRRSRKRRISRRNKRRKTRRHKKSRKHKRSRR